MGGDNSDREEIDLLIRGLEARPLVPRKASAPLSQPPDRSVPAQPPSDPPVAGHQVDPRRWSSWPEAPLLMPSRPAPAPWTALASRPAISLPRLPDLTRFFRMPGQVSMARLWVGLGALDAAAMTFWPYPKTYFWGVVVYLLSLGLVAVTGVWGARLTWDTRLGAAHTIALGTVVWAVTLATALTLPLV
jgi:hypothetical protein